MEILSYKDSQFYLDNKPFQIISGAIHYFRTYPQYWQDRLKKLKNCGFNTVETYMPWNLHEPVEGNFNFKGMLDIEKFIEIAENLGLKVIVRPGPYICAEWEFGGFPSWLLKDGDIKLRCYYKPYLEKVRNYYTEVMNVLKPHLATNGGNIIAMQIENEYGSFGNDKKYLRYIEELMRELGCDVLMFTSDGGLNWMLNGGTLPDIFKIVNFGSGTKRNFEQLKKHQPNGPYMCGEFWNGWFDHWGENHITRDKESVGEELEEILAENGNVNFYMFHGGTNFNFYNGSNFDGEKIQPTVTSYDYDCLLSENGNMTPKYYLVKDILKKHGFETDMLDVFDIPCVKYEDVKLTQSALLFENLLNLSTPVKQSYTSTMEEMGQSYGFILYRTYLTYEQEKRELHIDDVHDRAMIFINGCLVGIKDRMGRNDKIEIEVNDGETLVLDILVENLGRINYGPFLKDRKGITERARLGLQTINNWEIYNLPLTDLSKLQYSDIKSTEKPCFYKGILNIENEPQDTFLNCENFTKGSVFVNGENLGRFWDIGPLKTIYIPAPVLKKGENIIEIFELHKLKEEKLQFTDKLTQYKK